MQEKRIAAQSLDENELLTKLTNNDLIALEAKYHKNCAAKVLTKTKSRQSSTTGPKGNLATFDTAFESLISDSETDLNQGAAFDMSFLLTRYKEYLRQARYDDYDSYKSERLKARLNNYFKEAIIIQLSGPANKPDLVYIHSFIHSFNFIYPRYPFKYSNKYLISQGAVLKIFTIIIILLRLKRYHYLQMCCR